MKFTYSLFAIAALSSLSGCVVVANPERANVHLQRELQLDASALSKLIIEAGAGDLTIIGEQQRQSIDVSADIFTTDSRRDDVELTLTKAGDDAKLVAKHYSTSGFWLGESPKVDVTLYVPADLMLAVDDGSGDMVIRHMSGGGIIVDGSGELQLQQLSGNYTLEDNSGDIAISDLQGNITIEDGSGAIYIASVNGHVVIADDSGDIEVSKVTGNVSVNDGSGEILLRQVDGMVTVEDGSGDIVVEQAGGLTIHESGSGELKVKDVKGPLEIDS